MRAGLALPSDVLWRDYQVAAIAAVHAAQAAGQRRVVVIMATGAGKTFVAAGLIATRPGRTLFLAHRDELISQAVDKILTVLPECTLEVGVVKAERNAVHRPIVVASVQTLARRTRLAQLTPDFTTVIVDECHHCAAVTYEFVLEYLGAFDPGGPLLVGLTATPQRGDQVGLHEIFDGGIVYSKGLPELIREDYLCDLRGLQVELSFDFRLLQTHHGDYNERQLGEVLLAKQAPNLVLQAWQRYGEGRKTLIFCPTVAVSDEMAQTFQDAGIAAASVDGGTPLEERRATLQAFHTGEVQVLSNCAVLTEGYDEPSVGCVIVARPTKSQLLYAQMIGRCTRKFPGKPDALVIDIVGNTKAHDLVVLPTLFGLPLEKLRGQLLTEALEEYTTKGRPVDRGETGPLVATPVDLFVQKRRASVTWLTVAPDVYSLPLGGGGYVVVLPDGEDGGADYAVVEVGNFGHLSHLHKGPVPLSQALGHAETLVRQRGAERLIHAKASWRDESAARSEKMCALARRRGMADPEAYTKGEVGDWIDRSYLQEWLARGATLTR